MENIFPMENDKCPNCGCEQTVAKLKKEQLVEEGRMNPDIPVAIAQSVTPFADPATVLYGVQTPALISKYDICKKCFTYYCVRVDEGEVILGPGSGGPPPTPNFQNPFKN